MECLLKLSSAIHCKSFIRLLHVTMQAMQIVFAVHWMNPVAGGWKVSNHSA